MKHTIKSLIKLSPLALALLIGSTAQSADQTIDIEYYQAELGARGSNMIPLKYHIGRQHPGLRLENFLIERLWVHAKSKFGRGNVELQIGGRRVSQANVPGNPRDYDLRFPGTFRQLRLEGLPGRAAAQQTWQLFFSGQVKVLRITLRLKDIRTGGGGGRIVYQSGPSLKLPRREYTSQRLTVNVDNVERVRLTRTQGRIVLDKVTVVFGNGERRLLSELTGQFREAFPTKEAQFRSPRRVQALVIEGRPRDSNRAGIINVDLGVRRRR